MKRLGQELAALAFTLCGCALCLITLSGATRVLGLWLTGGALLAHLSGLLIEEDK